MHQPSLHVQHRLRNTAVAVSEQIARSMVSTESKPITELSAFGYV